jgi:hypothetical protein
MKLLCSALCSLVLGPGGDVNVRHEPGLPAADPVARAAAPADLRGPMPRATRRATGATVSRARGAQATPTVLTELARMRDAGLITPEDHDARRAAWNDARRFTKKLKGARRNEMRGVIKILQGIAARGALTPTRLPSLFQNLAANRRWWSEGPLLRAGARVSLEGSELIYQYFPGQGIQFHPLANFGKLNALWRLRAGDSDARMQRHYEELVGLRAERAGGIAWEYDFWFGGGAPPWVSGMAQGTAIQAIARTGQRLERIVGQPGRKAEGATIAKAALGIFRTAPPEGVRKPIGSGVHYLLYSHSPRLYVINGFLQSLVGLYDYAQVSGDPEGAALFADGERRAREELPLYDTGAWSLYSRGSARSESSLSYHTLTRDFLDSLCDRLKDDPLYCSTETAFTAYLSQPPELLPLTDSVRGGTLAKLRFDLSKISRVAVRVTRGTRTVFLRSALTFGRGTPAVTWAVPRRAGTYAWAVTATDLAGNTATATAKLRVLKPRKR